MKPIAINVPGSVVTKETAPGYLLRVAKILLSEITMESSVVLEEIEERIVNAGFLTWPECEEIEIKAMG